MGLNRSPADDAFSKCIRLSVNYECERCGKQYDKSSTGLHCSHNFSRRHRTIRWCKENALSMCYSCHSWFADSPWESSKWLEGKLGVAAIEALVDKKNAKIKVSKLEEKDIAKHYREQLKILEQKRNDGETGYITFESWQ